MRILRAGLLPVGVERGWCSWGTKMERELQLARAPVDANRPRCRQESSAFDVQAARVLRSSTSPSTSHSGGHACGVMVFGMQQASTLRAQARGSAARDPARRQHYNCKSACIAGNGGYCKWPTRNGRALFPREVPLGDTWRDGPLRCLVTSATSLIAQSACHAMSSRLLLRLGWSAQTPGLGR